MADLRYYVDGGWVSGWSKVLGNLVDLYASSGAPGIEKSPDDVSEDDPEEDEDKSAVVAPGKLSW